MHSDEAGWGLPDDLQVIFQPHSSQSPNQDNCPPCPSSPQPLSVYRHPPHAPRPTSRPAETCFRGSALSTPPRPERLGVGPWTQSQLLSPETLPSVAVLGAGGRGRARPMSPMGDRAQAQGSEWDRRQQSWGWLSTLVPLPAHGRRFLLPPTLRWQEAGPVSANQQPGRARALSSVAVATSPLNPLHCARDTEMAGRTGLRDSGEGCEPPSRPLGLTAGAWGAGNQAEITARV